jgi:predicted Rossmann fold flavoprotein
MRAAQRGRRTLLIEKNRKLGVKILMSGGTRCNLTHDTDPRGIAAAFGDQGRFLHSALAALPPTAVVDLVESAGVPTKIEATGKIFPISDRAIDVRDAFLRLAEKAGVDFITGSSVLGIARRGDEFFVHCANQSVWAERVIVTTGGASYPGCGTSGDGYGWAAELGHTIIPPRPALTPLVIEAPWLTALSGITLPDAQVTLVLPDEARAARRIRFGWPPSVRGALLLAHFGLSGPAVLDISRELPAGLAPGSAALAIDWCPAVDRDHLLHDLIAAIRRHPSRRAPWLVAPYVPDRLGQALLRGAEVDSERSGSEISKAALHRLVGTLKETRVAVIGPLGFAKAEVTAGGVALDEIDSRTMESKRARGLFLAGEILDVDGPIGGYNFQAAFSTGHLAGSHA